MVGEARWPLTREQHELLVMLASMLQRFGAERFLEARLVAANRDDFPDPWEGTLQSVHQVLYRLCWHAYIDPEIVVEDHRPAHDEFGMLRTSDIALGSVKGNTGTFHVFAIGNDDIAGLLSHRIGGMFLELAPAETAAGDPFRTASHEIEEREASVAAVFLGLGVPAANSSMYRRHAAEIRGREEHSEQQIARAGGLDIAEITMLVAIQDILRDEVQGALSTLHPAQQEWVEQWKEALDPHEDELRELLGLRERPASRPLTRPVEPRKAPAHDEGARRRFNADGETMRVVNRSLFGLVPGGFLGMMLGVALWKIAGGTTGAVAIVAAVAGTIAGCVLAYPLWCKPYYRCTDGDCTGLVGADDPTCRHCGGRITRTVTQPELEEMWRAWREEEDARDEEIDESEFAGDPDADVVRSEKARTRPARRARGA